jgi:Ca2+-binding EF-hand superfamily protein
MATSDSPLLDSFERAFEHHADSDEGIDADKMSEVLGLRTESIAQNMFAIFDEKGDGAISRDELIAVDRGCPECSATSADHDRRSEAVELERNQRSTHPAVARKR